MPDILSHLILARLLVAPSADGETLSALQKVLIPLAGAEMSAPEWKKHFVAKVEELLGGNLVSQRKRGRISLTPAGKTTGLKFLGCDAPDLPLGATWRMVVEHYLVALALGADVSSAKARSHVAKSDGMLASILKKHFGLKAAELPNLKHVISILISDILKAHCHDAKETRKALLRQWVGEQKGPAEFSVAAPTQTQQPAEDLPSFAKDVLSAARATQTGRFGDHKVFISHVWQKLQAGHSRWADELGVFRRRLVESNRLGLLGLDRADLVEAMSPEDVAASATFYLTEVFHFIRI